MQGKMREGKVDRCVLKLLMWCLNGKGEFFVRFYLDVGISKCV